MFSHTTAPSASGICQPSQHGWIGIVDGEVQAKPKCTSHDGISLAMPRLRERAHRLVDQFLNRMIMQPEPSTR